MKITTTTNRNSMSITYGFIGFNFDFSEMETTVQTFKTFAKTFIPMDEKHLNNFEEKTNQIIQFIRTFNECIQVESTIEDWEAIFEIDIDEKTLIGKSRFIKLPIQDKDMVVTIDFMKIGMLIKEIIDFSLSIQDEEENDEGDKNEEPESTEARVKPRRYSSIREMSDFIINQGIKNEEKAYEYLKLVFPDNDKYEYQLAYERAISDKD